MIFSKRFPTKCFIIYSTCTKDSPKQFLTLRRARLAFKIAAALARAVPFCNLAVAKVGFLETAFFAPAAGFEPGFLAGTFLMGFPSLPTFLTAGLVVFLAATFFSAPAFLAGAFLSPALAAFGAAALEAAGFFSAGLAAFGAALAAAGLLSAAGRFSAFLGSAAGFLGAALAAAGFFSAAGFAAGVSFFAPVEVDAAGFLSFLSDGSAKIIERKILGYVGFNLFIAISVRSS